MMVWITPRSFKGTIGLVEGEPERGYGDKFRGKDGRLYGKTRWYETLEGAQAHLKMLCQARVDFLEREMEKVKAEYRRRA